MKTMSRAAAALAAALPFNLIAADANAIVAEDKTSVAPPADSAEEIAEDAARDLKDTRFYNKPGATRAEYERDWQECRLIARGSRTPNGSVPFYYNPQVISPVAATAGAGLAGLIAGAIKQGHQRRVNRRQCLMVKGWRLVDVPASDTARITAMTDAERSAYFDTIVGANDVQGEVTERTSFAFDAEAAGLNLNAPLPRAGDVFVGKKIDPAVAIVPDPAEAILVFAFRRPDEGSAGRSGLLTMVRYDPVGGDREYQPRDWKKTGNKTTYTLAMRSRDKKAAYEVQVVRVTPGSYVIDHHATGSVVPVQSYCLGAPVVQVEAGQVVYLGDFVPLVGARTKLGTKETRLAWTSNPDDARQTLARLQPALAERMQPAAWQNGATYACSAEQMDRWDLPGFAALTRPNDAAQAEPAPAAVPAEVRADPATPQPAPTPTE